MGILGLFLAIFFPYKTQPPKMGRADIIPEIKLILKNTKFLGHIGMTMLSYAQVYVFSSISAFLFRDVFHWTHREYSLVGLAIAGGAASGALLVRFLSTRKELHELIPYTLALMLIRSLTLLVMDHFSLATGELVMGCIFIFFIGSGMTASITISESLKAVNAPKELISSVLGLGLVTASSLGTGLSSLLNDTVQNTSLILLITPVGSLIIERFFLRK